MTTHRFVNLIAALGTALADAQLRACGRVGVTPSDAAVLITVGYHPGTSVGALAPIVGFTQSAAVRVVDRLVLDGLIARKRGGADQRQVRLSLTRKGAALRGRILDARRNAVEQALAPLDGEQTKQLQAIVELMLTALTHGRESADHICRFCDENVCVPAICPVEQAAQRQEVSS